MTWLPPRQRDAALEAAHQEAGQTLSTQRGLPCRKLISELAVHATLASSPEGVHTKQRARRTCACLPEVIMLFPDAATLAFLALVYFLVFRPRLLTKAPS
jgi:hypothetical protein